MIVVSGLFSLARILGECSTIHSPPALFWFKVEISSRTLIPLSRPASVNSGPMSWDDCGWVFPDEKSVSSCPISCHTKPGYNRAQMQTFLNFFSACFRSQPDPGTVSRSGELRTEKVTPRLLRTRSLKFSWRTFSQQCLFSQRLIVPFVTCCDHRRDGWCSWVSS